MSHRRPLARSLPAIFMILCLLLSSCQPETITVETEKVVTQVVEVEVTKVVAGEPVIEVVTVTPEPEPVEPPTKITWHAVTVSAADIADVNVAASEYLQSKGINAELELLPYTYAEYGEKVPLMLTTGEECDLVFTASWGDVNVHNFSSQGAFMPLDNLLPEYAPELWASLTPEQWNAGRAIPGGRPITAVPNYGSWLPNRGMRVLVDILEKYPFEALDRPSHIVTLAEWEPYMKMVMENEPDLEAFTPRGTYGSPANDYGYDYIPGYATAIVGSEDASLQVVSIADMPFYLEYAKMMKRWVDEGLMFGEALNTEESIASFAAGRFAGHLGYWTPSEDNRSKADYAGQLTRGAWIDKQHLAPFRTTVQMTAVCASSKSPEVAVQVLNMANMDPYFYNLISLGIEGQHWNWVDQDKGLIAYPEGVNSSNVGYLHRNWMLASTYNLYYFDEVQADMKVQEIGRKLNETTPPSVLLGFVFDPTVVEGEIAECNAVVGEFTTQLNGGVAENVEATMADLQAELKACGNDAILAEIQAQLDAWK